MEKLCLIGLMVFVSIFGAAYCSEEVVGNGKDINTEAVVADSLVVSIPLEKQDVEKDADGWASVEFVKGIEGIAEKDLVALGLLRLPIKEAQKGNILQASWAKSLYLELRFGTQRYL